MLAGAAEWLSAEFDLPKPAWVDKPQYFLNSPCPREDVGLDMSEFHQERLRRSPEASGLLSAETLNSYTESTCDFEKVVFRKSIGEKSRPRTVSLSKGKDSNSPMATW